VLNNDSLGWIKLHEKANKGRYIAVDFEAQPDFVKIAEASGCYGTRVTDPEDIKKALSRAKKENDRGVPAMVQFEVDPWDFPDGFKEFSQTLLASTVFYPASPPARGSDHLSRQSTPA
jgi:thiamine pyrophosphate-dependent acetolactate synthase large subunit-like protein